MSQLFHHQVIIRIIYVTTWGLDDCDINDSHDYLVIGQL
jgi:hypothetical protein